MKHIPYEVICRIADGKLSQGEMKTLLDHAQTCLRCSKEIELQKSIKRIVQTMPLMNPAFHFTGDVLDALLPSRQKKWYERFLHNLGNIFAMTAVLSFLGYLFSVIGTGQFQVNLSSSSQNTVGISKIYQEVSHQLINSLTSKLHSKDLEIFNAQLILIVLLAFIILIFLDRIVSHFFNRLKA
jgi:hypothetical protein